MNRDSQQTKVNELMESVPDMLDEMDANWELKNAIISITPGVLRGVKDFSTAVGMLINLFYLLYSRRVYHYREAAIEDWVLDAMKILGYIQGASSGILIYLYAKNKQKLIIKKGWRDFNKANLAAYGDLEKSSRLNIEEMSYEMTHMILMLRGPDSPEFLSKNEETDEQQLNFGNFFTAVEH